MRSCHSKGDAIGLVLQSCCCHCSVWQLWGCSGVYALCTAVVCLWCSLQRCKRQLQATCGGMCSMIWVHRRAPNECIEPRLCCIFLDEECC
jgi:hypothetical protein